MRLPCELPEFLQNHQILLKDLRPNSMMLRYSKVYLAFFAFLLLYSKSGAQQSTDTLLHLKGAGQLAEQHYHLLQARKYEAEAAQQNIALAEYSRKPSIDASYHANIGTANNLTGIFYPVGILPMTGPPSISNNYKPATG